MAFRTLAGAVRSYNVAPTIYNEVLLEKMKSDPKFHAWVQEVITVPPRSDLKFVTENTEMILDRHLDSGNRSL